MIVSNHQTIRGKPMKCTWLKSFSCQPTTSSSSLSPGENIKKNKTKQNKTQTYAFQSCCVLRVLSVVNPSAYWVRDGSLPVYYRAHSPLQRGAIWRFQSTQYAWIPFCPCEVRVCISIAPLSCCWDRTWCWRCWERAAVEVTLSTRTLKWIQ